MGGSSPDVPDYLAAEREGMIADLDTYPLRYMVEALSRMGGRATIDGQEYDFTGLGDVDTAGVISDQMAQVLLDIQRGMAPQFIAQRIEELKAADPEGYAARQQLFDRIMASVEAQPDRPLAEGLQNEIASELSRGGQLDARQREQVQQGVRGQQLRRGLFLGNAPAQQEGQAIVEAGENMNRTRQQQALAFLQSGAAPEDVEYRRMQQALGNLGAFMENRSPQAEFGSLSAAGNGAAPFTTGGWNQQQTQYQPGQGFQNAMALYTGQVNFANSQVNPWIAGASIGLGGLNAAANLGWNPWNQPAAQPAQQSGGWSGWV